MPSIKHIKGLEEFENKVERIAQEGENSEDDSWLGRIYQQFKHLMKDEDGSEPDRYNVEGLEPPMFDDTWGLADDFDVMMKNGKRSRFYKTTLKKT